MFTGTTFFAAERVNGIKGKILEMDQKTLMKVIGGLLTIIILLLSALVSYFVLQNDKRIETNTTEIRTLRDKQERLAEKYNQDIATINVNITKIAEKLKVHLSPEQR